MTVIAGYGSARKGSVMADASAALERGGLARGAIGLREVLFQAVPVVRPPARLPKMQQVFSDDVAPTAAGSMAGQEGA